MGKVISVIIAVAISFSATAQKLKGSDTLLPLIQKHSECYFELGKGAISITGGGSGVGISALYEGSTDVAMASREIKFTERLKFKEAKKNIVEKVIAYDALAVVVNPTNPIDSLTRQQLEDIFTGKIKNWSELGGYDAKIVVYTRETSSGTYEFFKSSVLKNKNYQAAALSMPATGAIMQSVAQTKGAIGYVGQAYVNSNVKVLSVSYNNINYYKPTYTNSKDKLYPICRPLLLYYLKDSNDDVVGFVDYVTSYDGQQLVKSMGYIDVL